MKHVNLFYLFFLFQLTIIFPSYLNAEDNKKDSLFCLLKSKIADTSMCKTYIEIANYYQSFNIDSVLFWNNKALELTERMDAKKYSETAKTRISHIKAKALQGIAYVYYYRDNIPKAIEILNDILKIVERIDDKNGIANIYSNLGIMYKSIGNYDEAIMYIVKSEKLYTNIKSKDGIAGCKSNLGIIYTDLGNYPLALNNLLEAVKVYTELNDKKLLGQCYNNISILYYNENNNELALDYCKKSISNRNEIKDYTGLANSYTTMGNILSSINKSDSAIFYYKKVLEMYKKTGNLSGQAIAMNNMALEMLDNNQVDEAMSNFQEALKISEEIDAKLLIANILNNISKVYKVKADYKKSLSYSYKSLELSRKLNLLSEQKSALRILSEVYEITGDFRNSLKFHKEFKLITDSIFNEESSKQVKEMEAKYQTEKKQMEIDKLEKDKILQKETIERQKAENQRQQVIIFTIIAGLLLILIFSALLYRLFIQKKKANILLEQKNAEILQQKEEIEAQRDLLTIRNEEVLQQKEEIEAQRDEIEIQKNVVTEQKEHIEEIHKEVTDSINYATRLQSAILPDPEILNKYISESFILYKPKDKVSGDFYWWTIVENNLIITVADCTGHGVPGAFMSMLGTSLLREIVVKEYITNPSIILKRLRKEIVFILKQKGVSGEQKDGMDMALISINTGTLETQFSGANNSLYFLRNGELSEIKGDKMPIAIHEHMDAFSIKELQLQKGDCLFLMSDGFEDQFGGKDDKKFKSKKLKEELLSVNHLPMAEQFVYMDKSFENWKGQNEQTDDVTLIGFKIK